MNWYYGPTDYNTLKNYDRNLEKIVPLGWGVFGWINKFIFIPLFGFLSSFMGLGIAIIIFTILIKIAMSPITFKSFLSQAKMKVLRPEITEIGEKFKKDPMKKQQETMKLYNKAGVNPMAGCIPALIQIPFMYASFQFFPSAFELRQKGFLWADDLSSFDEIFKLPFHIPLYGDHVSLFPILDNEFMTLKEDSSYASPISSVFYEYYEDLKHVTAQLEKDKDRLQCIVSNQLVPNSIPFGTTQKPNLWDYADAIDTMAFLTNLR